MLPGSGKRQTKGKDEGFFDGPDSEMKMRLTAMGARILLAGVLVGVIPAAAFAGAQATTPSPKSFATAHSVVVIGPNSPVFESVLEKDFPGVTQVNYFQQIEPLLAIVHNNTRRVVKAYVVKWTITNADGTTSTAMLPVMWEPPPGDPRLAGTVAVLGPAGTGLGTQLISPFFHWSRKRFPIVLGSNAAVGTFSALAQQTPATQQPLVRQAHSGESVRVTLDGVIFGDGVFVGPDTSLLYERFQAAQQAEADEAAWASNQLSTGVAKQQLEVGLSQQIYNGRKATGGDQASFYETVRGREAERFLGVLGRHGLAGLTALVSQIAAASRLAITKQGGS